MADAPGWPGGGPLSYQLVTPGWLSGGTASVPFRFRPREMILACTLIAGMSMLTGLDGSGRGPVAWRGKARLDGSAARAGRCAEAAQAGGTGGGAQRKVSCPMKAMTTPVTIMPIAARLSQEIRREIRRTEVIMLPGCAHPRRLGLARLTTFAFPRSAAIVAVSFPAVSRLCPARLRADTAGLS